MMKKLLVLGSIVLVLNSCSKSDSGPAGCTYTAPTALASNSEITILQAYAATNHPAAIQHSSGFFYEITAPGTGTVTAAPCSTILVKYSRYSIPANVKLEDHTSPVSFTLGGLFQAWQYAIPMIKTGGTMMLLVPPSLADGNYHKFYIELVGIN